MISEKPAIIILQDSFGPYRFQVFSAQDRDEPIGGGPGEATETIGGLKPLYCEDRGESWDCSAWSK